MLSVVTFKWQTPGYHTTYTAAHVNALQRGVARYYPKPHRFCCVTDDPEGLGPDVWAIPLWSDFGQVPSPHGGHYPSCYRRLKVFDPEMATILGDRFVVLDLDAVVTGDLRPIFDRPVDFAMWQDPERPHQYNGSLLLMSAGARPQIWRDFDPEASPRLAVRAGCKGSDQGWISYRLGPGESTFDRSDGVYSYRMHLRGRRDLPTNARLILFHGREKPWGEGAHARAWLREATCH